MVVYKVLFGFGLGCFFLFYWMMCMLTLLSVRSGTVSLAAWVCVGFSCACRMMLDIFKYLIRFIHDKVVWFTHVRFFVHL